MKKAVEIINITIENETAVVEYITGTIRKYPMDKLPGTVQRWLDEHQEEPAPTAIEEAEQAWMEAVDDEDIAQATIMLACVEPEAVTEEAIEASYSIIARETTALVATEDEEPTQEPTEETSHIGQAVWAGIRTAAPVIGRMAVRATKGAVRATKGAVRATKAIVRTAPKVINQSVSMALWMADKATSVWYLLTTYLPIWFSRLVFLLTWDVLPMLRRAGRITGKTLAQAGMAIGGWALVAATWLVAGAAKVSEEAVKGWKLREEIIREQAA